LEWVQDDFLISSHASRCNQAQEEGVLGSKARIHDGERVCHLFHATLMLRSKWRGYRWEEARVFSSMVWMVDLPMLWKHGTWRISRPWLTRHLCSRTEEEYWQASTSRNTRVNRTATPGPALVLCLLDLPSTPCSRVFNRYLNRLDRDLSPHIDRWFHATIFFRPQTLVIRMSKGPQLLKMQCWWSQARLVSTVESQVTLPSSVPIDVNRPPQLKERLHHQTALEALPQPNLNRTMLKEEWTKWLCRTLRTPQPWRLVHLSSILFCLNHSLLSFLFCSLESQGEIPSC
jgi:hypothetical protein